jgi:molybdopterin-guanine dinucleotide biosynthesis protein A
VRVPCSGVILAGGRNSRFSGINKALLRVGAKRILDRVYGVFSELFEEIFIVTNDPLQYSEWNVTIVTDLFSVRSSLTGIHAGLFHATHPYAFFAACDVPFIQKGLVETILDHIRPGSDLILPETAQGLEPLCAAYSRKSLPAIERHILENRLKIQLAFRKDRIQKVPEKRLREKDPELLSFFNINTPEDLARAREIEKRSSEPFAIHPEHRQGETE